MHQQNNNLVLKRLVLRVFNMDPCSIYTDNDAKAKFSITLLASVVRNSR